MSIIESLLLAASLCADSFAVSLCSGVTIRNTNRGKVLTVAICFAVIQSGLLLTGWLCGNLFVGLVEKAAHFIGFALLLYVGGSMVYEGLKGNPDSKDLNGIANILICGIATSIDALAVGVSQSMSGQKWSGFSILFIGVFLLTAIFVITGICGGRTIGSKVGRNAEVAGGIVLALIGVGILLG